jgi:hypothetical protein
MHGRRSKLGFSKQSNEQQQQQQQQQQLQQPSLTLLSEGPLSHSSVNSLV